MYVVQWQSEQNLKRGPAQLWTKLNFGFHKKDCETNSEGSKILGA